MTSGRFLLDTIPHSHPIFARERVPLTFDTFPSYSEEKGENQMPPIDRAEARKCVRKALRAVADFSGSDFEDFTFEHWHAFHRTVFINVVASCISAKGSRLVISEDTLDEVDTVGAFVDWVNHNSAYRGEPESAMAVSEGDLRPS